MAGTSAATSGTAPPRVLPISDLHLRHEGVSAELAGTYYAATSVCLTRHHASPALVSYFVTGGETGEMSVEWEEPSATWVRSFANVDDTTRDAAYCVALAFVEAVRGLAAIRRAEGGSGADYYLVPLGTVVAADPDLDLEGDDVVRLEVSGINADTNSNMSTRLAKKVAQLGRGRSDVQGIAVVVGFRTPAIRSETASNVA